MISQRRLAANRANAKKSTGPKTAAGKRSSSQNALRHGLDRPTAADAHALQSIVRIASEIAGPNPGPITHQLAMTIAEAQSVINRVRLARVATIVDLSTNPLPSRMPLYVIAQDWREALAALRAGKAHKANRIIVANNRKMKVMLNEMGRYTKALNAQESAGKAYEAIEAYKRNMGIPRSHEQAFVLAVPRLLALERYERRAVSRRNRAISTLRYLQNNPDFAHQDVQPEASISDNTT